MDFYHTIKNLVAKQDYPSLVSWRELNNAALAHPTSEHYLPLLYVLGAAGNERPRFFNETIFGGSVSIELYRVWHEMSKKLQIFHVPRKACAPIPL